MHISNYKDLFYSLISGIVLLAGCTGDVVQQKQFTCDEDGMLVIDGKRTFIIGSYHHPKTSRPFNELAKHGYN